MHYKKGATIPKWIGKARNPRHQCMITFNVPVDVRGKTVRALKHGRHVIDISVPRILKKKFGATFRDVFVDCKPPTDYGISLQVLDGIRVFRRQNDTARRKPLTVLPPVRP